MAETILPFIEPFQSVVMSTVDGAGEPFASYAPFLHDEHRYYVFISDIATHAKNITAHPSAALLFIEEESAAANLFARKRIAIQCRAEKISRDDDRFETVMERFKARFEMIGMLQQMQDFNLYAFTPKQGEATFGFGEAYTLGGEHMETLIPRSGGGGHRKTEA
jgi:putative heme iron utilization protein